ncbi:MAG: hypothetical protein IJQ12_02520 [Lachnospiraceae bacterium]|nr:hypothetical protein [Lachnospiraceae bacterium]
MKDIVYGAFGIFFALLIFAGSVVGYNIYITMQAQKAAEEIVNEITANN